MINESLVNVRKHFSQLHYNNSSHIYHSIAIGTSYGTFGELLQGLLPDNNHFLVTFPIASYSKSIIIPDKSLDQLEVYPNHKKKSLKLAQAILDYYNIKFSGKIIIKSELEEGKGLASSSADLVATAKAMEQVLNINIENEILLNMLRKIEPTDGVMFPGYVSFYHKKVELLEYLGHLPTLTVIAIDEGGEVNTIEYNQLNHHFTVEEKIEYQAMLVQISEAIKTTDLKTIGKIATRSAILHQKRNKKYYLNEIINISNSVGAIGVNVAHSGTCLGIILENNDKDFNRKFEEVIYQLSKITCNFGVYESMSFT